MLREAFYYLLGGVTFLPICILAGLIHFYLSAPPVQQTTTHSIEADIDLTHEKKLAALDLAARNAAIHAEIEKDKGKDHPQGDATAPPTAKRLGPGSVNASAPKPFSSGWLTVRSTFESDSNAANTTSAASTPAAIPASLVDGESDAARLQAGDDNTAVDNSDAASIKSTNSNASTGYMSQMYRGILDYRIGKAANKKSANDASSGRSTPTLNGSSAAPTGTAGRESFYCILKSPILYLYSSDDTANPTTECHAAIDLRGKRVSIFVSGHGDTLGELEPEQSANDEEQLGDAAADEAGFDAKKAWARAKRAIVRDGELFMKRNAIRIVGSATGRSVSPGDRKAGRATHLGRKRPQWFIFCKNNYYMEDWYHALLQASLMPDPSLPTKLSDDGPADPLLRLFGKLDDPIGPTFSHEDMASLLDSLDSLPDPLPLRWLNALVGRIFFSVYRTAWLENYIVSKMMKKINRVKTPGFLGDIKVEEVDVGRRAPGFSRPMLKALTNEGEASMEIAIHYVGEIRITISTTLTLSLGSRFKPYNIPIVLAVVLRSLEGNLLLHVKRPPSNRLWFGFTTMPKMEIDIEPVVSARKVQWGMVTRLIESRLKELLQESIVVPNMDDISFFDTRTMPLRGVIFADAAKKSDLLRAELDGTSATATGPSDPSGASTQQDRDGKSTPGSTKTSDLLAANKVGTASAPVSGAATPVTPERRSASTLRTTLTDEDSEASAVNAGNQSSAALRNRKSGLDAAQAARTTSPAAAGLSDLLSRDAAAGGGSLGERLASGSPPRQDSQGTKRRTWFGAGPKSSSSSISSSSGLSTLGLGAGALGGRSGREQSSLALGNASIERPSQRSNSASVPAKSDAALALPSEAPARAVSDSVFTDNGNTDIARARSPSVLSTDGSEMDTRRGHDTLRQAALTAATMQREASRESDQSRPLTKHEQSAGTPSFIISSASEPVLALGEGGASAMPSLETKAPLEETLQLQGEDERDIIDSPSSLPHSTRSSLRSSRSDLVLPDIKKQGSGESHSSGLPHDHEFVSSTRQPPRDADSATASQQRSMAPPPPPPRRPTGTQTSDRSVSRQDAAAALSSVQRSRYGLNEGERTTTDGPNATQGTTSAMLLTSWNKAKASMADKESRQAAARDAKDAIKRGWASWNTKRAESKRMPLEDDDTAGANVREGLPRSNSSRLSLTPGKSAWLASSPPDPTSFGLGFDTPSPEGANNGPRHKHHGSTASQASNYTDTDDDNVSVHSNASSRQSYRELRALKKMHGYDDGQSDRAYDGRSRSSSTAKFPSGTSLSRTQSGLSSGDPTGWTAQWDADIPSLTPPAPAYREEDPAKDSRHKALERTISNETPVKMTPPALPNRKPSSSISSTGGGISFIPPAPAATIELASTSSLEPSDISTDPQEGVKDKKNVIANDEPAVSASGVASLAPRTPERRTPGQADEASSATPVPASSERAQRSNVQTSQESNEPEPTPTRLNAGTLSREPSLASTDKAAVHQDSAPAVESAAAESTPSQTDAPYSSVNSPNPGSGIKKQPTRATMMAVPGIPSMQKASPQSFSAPPPPEPASSAAADGADGTSPSAFRTATSSLFKMPNFGSPILTSKGSSSGGGGLTHAPPQVPARPAAASATDGSALGLTQMGSNEDNAVESTARRGEANIGGSGTFAQVAKAEGPAADAKFDDAQLEAGDTIHVGNKEVKVPMQADVVARKEAATAGNSGSSASHAS